MNEKKKYRIRVNAAPGFYFSKWFFGVCLKSILGYSEQLEQPTH